MHHPFHQKNFGQAMILCLISNINSNSNIDLSKSGYSTTNNQQQLNSHIKNSTVIDNLQNILFNHTPNESYQKSHSNNHTPNNIENFEQFNTLPNNLNNTPINTADHLNNYNNNLFINNIQPNVYVKTDEIEPLNSNIGITETNQSNPVIGIKINDNVIFKKGTPEYNCEINGPNESNVYDPRFTGYGTNYRTYIESVTGQPRFYYDDVMIHRQNNYLTRNKLDFTNFGSQINNAEQKHSNMEIRSLAHNHFDNNTIDHRTDLQNQINAKMNANSWQQKYAPILQ